MHAPEVMRLTSSAQILQNVYYMGKNIPDDGEVLEETCLSISLSVSHDISQLTSVLLRQHLVAQHT